MAKFQANVILNSYRPNRTFRVSDSLTPGVSASWLDKVDAGKLVKMIGDSQYGLCAVGDQIEGYLATANDVAPNDGFALGSVQAQDRFKVTLDGLQATPGTGTVVIGDYVVTGTVTARGSVLPGPVKVCKATAAANTLLFRWRVVSLLSGNGAVGSIAVVEFV